MAKKSMIAREKKRTQIAAKYAVKRAALKATLVNTKASDEEKWEAQIKPNNIFENKNVVFLFQNNFDALIFDKVNTAGG